MLREIEHILILLHRIDSYYSTPVNEELSENSCIIDALETSRL